jgi:hypothetical protein
LTRDARRASAPPAFLERRPEETEVGAGCKSVIIRPVEKVSPEDRFRRNRGKRGADKRRQLARKRREIFQSKKIVLDTVRSMGYVWVYPEIEILPVSAMPLQKGGIAEIR